MRATWVYGPCALGPEQYWVFEQYPPGRKTLVHGPYRDYGQCDRARKQVKGTIDVGGQCLRKAKAALRMTKDGTLAVPQGAPPLD